MGEVQNVSSRRQYRHHFDWDEAKRRYVGGERVADLAAEYGVSVVAIYRVLNPKTYERMKAAKAAWQTRSTCPDCGVRTTRTTVDNERRCVRCSAIAKATSVRDEELHCATCDEWKPDATFPSDKRRIARRGRHRQCTQCQTLAKRLWRKKNPDKDKAANERQTAKRRKAAA